MPQKTRNGCTYGRDTRKMLEDFKDVVEKLINNEIRHIDSEIGEIKKDIQILFDSLSASKKLMRVTLYSLFATIIGALVVALLTKI